MKKRLGHICLWAILFVSLTGQTVCAQESYYHERRNNREHRIFNYGLKVGLNAPATTRYSAIFDETPLTNESFHNKTGYDVNAYFRINIDYFFMQPELEWRLLKQNISFSVPAELTTDLTSTEFSITAQTANTNVLVGYNIVKNGPFLLGAYIGPSFRCNFNTRYDDIREIHPGFTNKNLQYNIYGAAGFSIIIAKVHFDIRYKIGFLDADIHFNEMEESSETLEKLSLHKRENILSFACGVMF
ncbi:MAG: PorT family protein [Candidatus Symbiothrix sp.]|jgi:hypothetical protein|nr:PorT family protein [Candidatus Symbiothrix sp.]